MPASLVHPLAVVDPLARVGEDVEIGPFSLVEADVEIGRGCRIGSHARIASGTVIGAGCRILQGAAVGGTPQVLGFPQERKGLCRLGEAVTVGEYATIHAGSAPGASTAVGDGCFLMAYAHVGHDCRVEAEAILANAVQLGGHVAVGKGAFLGGGCVIHQHCQVGELSFVAGGIPVDRDVLPWSRVIGHPARWARMNLVGLRRAGWAPRDIAEGGRWLRLLVGPGRNDAGLRELESSGDPRAIDLARFVRGSVRGIVRARI